MIYLQWMSYDGNRRKTQKTIKRKNETKENIFPVYKDAFDGEHIYEIHYAIRWNLF